MCKGTIDSDGLNQFWRKSTLNSLWKDWYWSSNTLATWCKEPSHWERPWCWERQRAGREAVTENEMVGWHHRLDGYEIEQTLGGSKGQRSLACCSPWGRVLDMTEQLNKTINFITVKSDIGERDQRITLLIKLIFVGMYLNYLLSC